MLKRLVRVKVDCPVFMLEELLKITILPTLTGQFIVVTTNASFLQFEVKFNWPHIQDSNI